MCSAATCQKCGKVTWVGCGQHVDQVFRNVPQENRCQCKPNPSAGSVFGF
ncbi:MAG: hypothetical protein GXX86_00395 [Propionibacterium sp.]|nr:hypothetical protein [Propionibacterium sp.]